MVLNDGKITINAVDLSSKIKSFEWTPLKAIFETTGIDVSAVTREGGNGDNTLTIEFFQSFAASSVWVTLYDLIGTSTEIVLQLTTGAASATNPIFTFDAILEAFPIGGGAGDLMMTSVTFHGTGAIAKNIGA